MTPSIWLWCWPTPFHAIDRRDVITALTGQWLVRSGLTGPCGQSCATNLYQYKCDHVGGAMSLISGDKIKITFFWYEQHLKSTPNKETCTFRIQILFSFLLQDKWCFRFITFWKQFYSDKRMSLFCFANTGLSLYWHLHYCYARFVDIGHVCPALCKNSHCLLLSHIIVFRHLFGNYFILQLTRWLSQAFRGSVVWQLSNWYVQYMNFNI